ncbi:MAG: ABC transporter substrate-binding protein [Anaerolineae bacterium]|nr:ABC transporter substrate-binding protein [Anaerolineae bacterium]
MSLVARLTIVDPEERFTVHDLDQAKGVITIGQDPTDDLILASPDPIPFHLELDYRQQPYRLTIPGQAQAVTINREFVPSGDSYEIRDRDVIRVAGYTMTFRAYDDEPEPAVEPPPSPPAPEPEFPPPLDELPPVTPPDHELPPAGEDDAGPSILTSLPEQEQAWTIDVEQTATFHLRVVNAGPLVAEFNIAVEGVPPEWVDIDPVEIHLNERADRTVIVTVTPPRLPTSRAGVYHLALVVTSPDHYPGERSAAGADITIRPYYALALGNPSPQLQSISWSQPSGQVEIPVTNKGNSEAWVGLAGEDDAHACRFEFQVPDEMDEPLHLTRQVNLRLPFDKALRVPVQLVPLKRPWIGSGGRLVDLRPRIHPYTITVTMAQGRQGPWTLIGEWETSPRFSRRVLSLFILAMLLLLLACTCVVFTPGIASPDQGRPAWVLNKIPPARYVQPASIRAGQVVELDWNAWPPFLVGFKLNGKSVEPPVIDRPERTTTYELRADTWLSHLLPALSETALDTAIVRPVEPDILLFEARPQRATPGQAVVLSWVVDDARELVLIDHGAGVQETLTTPYGSREVHVGRASVHYTLRAVGADGDVVERVVAVQVGSPVIDVFSVKPPAVVPPADVTLTWQVLGPDAPITLTRRSLTGSAAELVEARIDISGTTGQIVQPVRGTTLFSLTAGSGITQVVETVRVNILKPAPPSPARRASTTDPTPTPLPSDARAGKPGTIVVYTALSDQELAQTRLGATPVLSLTAVPDGLDETGLKLDDLRRDFDYVAAPSDALATNLLIVRESTEELIARLLAEKENPRADVIWVVAATGMIRLRAEGLLEPLAGVYEPQGLDKIKAGWSDPTLPPQWIGLSAWLTTFCVDEDRLRDESGNPLPVPRTWADLADPRYRGQIVMPAPVTSGTGYMVVSSLIQSQPFGERDGWAYLDRLHENIAWYTSHGDEPCQWVAAGQAVIGIGANLCASDGHLYPQEGAGWEIDAVALVRKDKISSSAHNFVTWAIGQQAMEEYAHFRAVLSYEGFEPPQPCVAGFDDIEIVPGRLFWASANFQRIAGKWQSRYGSQPD